MVEDKRNIFCTFELTAVEVPFKSQQANRPIFEDREFIRIVIGGDKNTEYYGPVTEDHKERFHEVYDRFQRGLKGREQMDGTPLSQWSFMKPHQVRELDALNIFTVEQLAALSDTQKQNLGMGAHDLVARAQAFLDEAKGGAVAAALASENAALKSDIADLKSQMAEMNALVTAQMATSNAAPALIDEARRGPGRPPKTARDELEPHARSA